MTDKFYIGVSAGAGPRISSRTKSGLSALVNEIFSEAQRIINETAFINDEASLDMGNSLVAMLENSEYTNAGRGSELTLRGSIECDASVILKTSKYTFASSGAVPNVVNPSALCTDLLKMQSVCADGKRKSSRSIPNFMVGSGARDYGEKNGIFPAESANPPDLKTQRAINSHKKWSKLLLESGNMPNDSMMERYMDTVGLIIVCSQGSYVASSSGGALSKDPGRIGPAASVGCGLDSGNGMSAVCSGFGEDIVTCRLGQLAVSGNSDLIDIPNVLNGSTLQQHPSQIGISRASCDDNLGSVLFEWMHTTPSMICAYAAFIPHEQPSVHINFSKNPGSGGCKL